MIFKTPYILVGIPIILMSLWFIQRRQKKSGFLFPSHSLLRHISKSWKIRLMFIPYVLRVIVLILFFMALARPQSVLEETIHKSEGIDIVLAIDSSGSMAAEDFKIKNKRVNRLEVVKNVVADFIQKRTNDRIALVVFSALAYTVCPLTTDYDWLASNLERVELGMIKDGTAIGSAIATSVTRLKQSKAKSRIIILLTDGMNNAGKIDPIEAAQAAKVFGIKIYTIGAGTKGTVPFPAKDMFGRKGYRNVIIDLDDKTLTEIAKVTGGQYFRAIDTASLRDIYQEIDKLEKTEIEEYGYFEYTELFDKFLFAALILLLLEIFLSRTVFLKIP